MLFVFYFEPKRLTCISDNSLDAAPLCLEAAFPSSLSLSVVFVPPLLLFCPFRPPLLSLLLRRRWSSSSKRVEQEQRSPRTRKKKENEALAGGRGGKREGPKGKGGKDNFYWKAYT